MSHQHQRRFALRALVIALLVLLPSGPLLATISSTTRYTIDFTRPEEAATKARWSPAERIEATAEGLGWDGETRSRRDIWVQSQPIGVGLWWRPAQSVSIRAKIEPRGDFHGTMFARFSPDARNWSNWQVLVRQAPRDRPDPKDRADATPHYVGRLAVPRRDTERYDEYLRQYRALDVPWTSDEEAAVKWILEQEPDFFERALPFVGYVQFLYEARPYGGQRLKALRFEMGWTVSGIHSLPRKGSAPNDLFVLPDGDFYMDFTPWKFRAQPSTDAADEQPEGTDQ